MSDPESETTPGIIFTDILNNYSKYYTEKYFKASVDFAMNNTYEKHLMTMNRLINNIGNS